MIFVSQTTIRWIQTDLRLKFAFSCRETIWEAALKEAIPDLTQSYKLKFLRQLPDGLITCSVFNFIQTFKVPTGKTRTSFLPNLNCSNIVAELCSSRHCKTAQEVIKRQAFLKNAFESLCVTYLNGVIYLYNVIKSLHFRISLHVSGKATTKHEKGWVLHLPLTTDAISLKDFSYVYCKEAIVKKYQTNDTLPNLVRKHWRTAWCVRSFRCLGLWSNKKDNIKLL